MLQIVENTRRKQLAWVQAILHHRGWSITRLAEEAGFHHSTLSKFLNDPNNIARLSSNIVEAIAQAGGIPPYYTEASTAAPGFEEAEAEPLLKPDGDEVIRAVNLLCEGRNGVDPWVLRSRALEQAGYMPGDILVVDLNATPQPGDCVCIQIYDKTGRAETAFRLLEPPFLVAASADPQFRRPILIDNDRAQVRGVVIASIRPRQVRQAA